MSYVTVTLRKLVVLSFLAGLTALVAFGDGETSAAPRAPAPRAPAPRTPVMPRYHPPQHQPAHPKARPVQHPPAASKNKVAKHPPATPKKKNVFPRIAISVGAGSGPGDSGPGDSGPGDPGPGPSSVVPTEAEPEQTPVADRGGPGYDPAPVLPGNSSPTVPPKAARKFVPKLATPWLDNLGLVCQATPNGVFVVSVTAGSPADLAGIQPGDTIVTANGSQVLSPIALNQAIQAAFDSGAGAVACSVIDGSSGVLANNIQITLPQ